MSLRIGVDIGGTFTDLVSIDGTGRIGVDKIASTPADYTEAIISGIARLLARSDAGGTVAELLHASTIASNALLEGKGAKTALITTAGFRDVLEIRDLRMPRLYDFAWVKPPALVPRRLRFEVDERIRPDGSIARRLDQSSLAAVIARIGATGIESVAIALLNSYANPAHENAVAAAIRAALPGLAITESAAILREIKEYPRTSTAVINARLMPLVADYLGRLEQRLHEIGIAAPLRLLQSNGGLARPEFAARFPAHIVESGPAAGVVGAARLARHFGEARLISFDMGGTTAKAGLIEAGEVLRAEAMEVGGGVVSGARLLKGAGYLLKLPSIDLAEVGAGGGSICRLDAAGAPKVGPESAGAEPGPVCYRRGGSEPTITDCSLVLGYLDPAGLAGGQVLLDRAAAAQALGQKIAAPLGVSLEVAAYGMLRVAAAGMMRAVRAVTVERGRDPREFSLFAFGGNGPLFAASLAGELGIERVLVPPHPGVFSALGLLLADTEYHLARTVRVRLDGGAEVAATLRTAIAELESEGAERLAAEGIGAERCEFRASALARYVGQSSELAVSIEQNDLRSAEFGERFAAEHRRTYGFAAPPGEPVEVIGLSLIARAVPQMPRLPERMASAGEISPLPSRACWFPGAGWLETPVLGRAALGRSERAGPLIIAEYDATTLVPPGASAAGDDFGMIRIRLR